MDLNSSYGSLYFLVSSELKTSAHNLKKKPSCPCDYNMLSYEIVDKVIKMDHSSKYVLH